MIWPKVLALSASAAASVAAWAQPAPRFSADQAAAAVPTPPDCTCRNFGVDLPLGARLCITTPQGRRLAICVREQNVTSWRTGDDSCGEVSQLSVLRP